MAVQLSFNQKIVSAACVVVIAAFAAFSVYNDYLQRKTLQDNLQTYLPVVLLQKISATGYPDVFFC